MSACTHPAEARDAQFAICTACGCTDAQIRAGRDKSATWDDVDRAYEDGARSGRLFAEYAMRDRVRRAYKLGMMRGVGMAYWKIKEYFDVS